MTRQKIIVSLASTFVVAIFGWMGTTVLNSTSELKVASTNISNCTKALDKLAERYEKMDERYDELNNTIIELKIRLEVTKLESMESSLSLVEEVETLKKNTSVIPYTGGPKIKPFVDIKPTYRPEFEDLNRKFLEQKKLVETLKESKR